MQGASWVVLHVMPLSIILLMQQASCEQGKFDGFVRQTRRCWGQRGALLSMIYVRLDVRSGAGASPLRVWVNQNSTVCYKARDNGVKEAIAKYLPGRRAADCNLYRRRCRSEPRSRRRQLPLRAHRCYKLLPIVPLVCRSSERPTRQRQCGVTTLRIASAEKTGAWRNVFNCLKVSMRTCRDGLEFTVKY